MDTSTSSYQDPPPGTTQPHQTPDPNTFHNPADDDEELQPQAFGAEFLDEDLTEQPQQDQNAMTVSNAIEPDLQDEPMAESSMEAEAANMRVQEFLAALPLASEYPIISPDFLQKSKDAMNGGSSLAGLNEFAPSIPIPYPANELRVIDFPGYVKNVDKALDMMGGLKNIARSFDGKWLELRLRPGDTCSHPIIGEVVGTSNVVLKVTRTVKRRKQKPGSKNLNNPDTEPPVVDIKTEFMGWATKTCRFRRLADYQYIVDPNEHLLKIRKALENYDINTIETFEFSRKDMNETLGKAFSLFPPPVFTRVDDPFPYNYQQTTSVKKTIVTDPNSSQQVAKLVPKSGRSKRVQSMLLRWGDQTTPTNPTPELVALRATLAPDELEAIEELFRQRPIWIKLAVHNLLPKSAVNNINALLRCVSYTMSSGPWRDTWIRFGYDPRNNSEARLYQILDLRNVRGTVQQRGRRFRVTGTGGDQVMDVEEHLAPGSAEVSSSEQGEVSEEGGGKSTGRKARKQKPVASNSAYAITDRDSHIFNGIVYKGAAVFQLIDLTDPELQSLLNSPTTVIQERCNDKDGWFTNEFITHIRAKVRQKIYAITGQVDSVKSARTMRALRRGPGGGGGGGGGGGSSSKTPRLRTPKTAPKEVSAAEKEKMLNEAREEALKSVEAQFGQLGGSSLKGKEKATEEERGDEVDEMDVDEEGDEIEEEGEGEEEEEEEGEGEETGVEGETEEEEEEEYNPNNDLIEEFEILGEDDDEEEGIDEDEDAEE